MPVQEIKVEEDSIELGEAPYFRSPYPDDLVQVEQPRTMGEREAVMLIDEHWPASIDELVMIAEEMHEQGDFSRAYSGSHIRNVLRSHYAPADMFEDVASDMQVDRSTSEKEGIDIPEPEHADDDWHKLFRLGIRAGIEKDVSQDEAMDAFVSGFIEGDKLRDEIDFDRLLK